MIHKRSRLQTQSMSIPRVTVIQSSTVLVILQHRPKNQTVHTSILFHPLPHLEAELLVIKLWEKVTTAMKITTKRKVKSMISS